MTAMPSHVSYAEPAAGDEDAAAQPSANGSRGEAKSGASPGSAASMSGTSLAAVSSSESSVPSSGLNPSHRARHPGHPRYTAQGGNAASRMHLRASVGSDGEAGGADAEAPVLPAKPLNRNPTRDVGEPLPSDPLDRGAPKKSKSWMFPSWRRVKPASSVAGRVGGAEGPAGGKEGGAGDASGKAPSFFRSVKTIIIAPIVSLLVVSNIITWFLGYQAVQTSMGDILHILEKDLLSKTARGAIAFLDAYTPALVEMQAVHRDGILTDSPADPNVHPWAFRMLEAWPQFVLCGAGYASDWYWEMSRDYFATEPRILYTKILYASPTTPVMTAFPADKHGRPIGNTSMLDDPNVVRRAYNFRPTQRGWYTKALAAGSEVTWTSSYFKVDGQLAMSAAATLFDAAGNAVGVGACAVEFEHGLSFIIQEIVSSFGGNTVAFVVEGGPSDYLLATSDGKARPAARPASPAPPRPALPAPLPSGPLNDPAGRRDQIVARAEGANALSTSVVVGGVVQGTDPRVSVWRAVSPIPEIGACLRERLGPIASIGLTDKGGAQGGLELSTTCAVQGAEMVVHASRVTHRGVNWLVVVSVDTAAYIQNTRRSAILTGVVTGAILVVAVAISVASALAISRPLRQLAAKMEVIRTLNLMNTPGNSARGSSERRIGSTSRVTEQEPPWGRPLGPSPVQLLTSAFSSMLQGIRAFAKFVPASVVQRTLASAEQAAELSLTQQRSSLFFLDVRDFTTLSATLAPGQLLEVMGDALSMLSLSIEQNLGTIDKFIGDAIMAFFSCPLALVEDHEAAACAAAVECQEVLMAMRPKWVARGLPPLEVRIGINTGDCLIGNFGCSSRFSYTAVGDAVNAAARLEPLNKRYGTTILISEDVERRAREKFFCRLVDLVVLKGRTRPCRIYELVARLGTETPAEREYAAQYERAFELFLGRRFAEAAAAFEAGGRLAAAVRLEREVFEVEFADAEAAAGAGAPAHSAATTPHASAHGAGPGPGRGRAARGGCRWRGSPQGEPRRRRWRRRGHPGGLPAGHAHGRAGAGLAQSVAPPASPRGGGLGPYRRLPPILNPFQTPAAGPAWARGWRGGARRAGALRRGGRGGLAAPELLAKLRAARASRAAFAVAAAAKAGAAVKARPAARLAPEDLSWRVLKAKALRLALEPPPSTGTAPRTSTPSSTEAARRGAAAAAPRRPAAAPAPPLARPLPAPPRPSDAPAWAYLAALHHIHASMFSGA
eukprot:tig00000553_g2126.t1